MTSPFKGSGSRSGVGGGRSGTTPAAPPVTRPRPTSPISTPVASPNRPGSRPGLPGSTPATPSRGTIDIGFGTQPRQSGTAFTALTAAEVAEKEKSRRDAYATLQQVLASYGLESLAPTVQQWLVEGLSEAEILQRMRETTEFKQRFPAIEERRKKGLAPISPGEYVSYERSARQMLRAAGLPEGFYDSPEDFQGFINNDLSLAELSDRVTLAANAAFRMSPEDRAAAARFGLGPGDLTAYWLDPDRAQPLLERKYAAIQLAGAAGRTGFGELTEDTASDLATLGVTRDEAERGFGDLAQQSELFGALDAGEDVIDQQAQLDAQFRGNVAARRRIEQRARRRAATFQQGGGFATSQGGVVGLGDTD